MIEKFADESWVHSVPFKLPKRDSVVFASAKAYAMRPARRTSGLLAGPGRIGYVHDAQTTTFLLTEDEEFFWEIRPREGALPEVPLVGQPSVVHTEHDEADVQVPLLRGGEAGRQYLLVVRIRTSSGAELMSTDTIYIKPLG
jgi:hypothetical protein